MTDKAWLKEELLRDLMRFNGNPNMTDYELGIASGIGTAINLTEKLEEQELTQRQVDKWLDKRDMVAVDAMMVYQTGMQNKVIVERPVIPQFVADYIERAKPRHDSLYQAIEERACEEVNEWIQAFYNSDKFARAWLDGYEVEEEQKYQVIIRDGEYIRLYLCKHGDNVIIGTNDNYIEKCPEVTYLTEQEIKGYDKRFWAFAEEVTPCN